MRCPGILRRGHQAPRPRRCCRQAHPRDAAGRARAPCVGRPPPRVAGRAGEKLGAAGAAPAVPGEDTEVFGRLPHAADERLKAAGARYYPWTTSGLPEKANVPSGGTLVRLVTSFATTEAEIDQFAA